ncbi:MULTISPECIES: hypothetical protein [unclassified Sphingobium]|uniref:hypothetical protein n=1 Tax=unclassified Sphingobium TaxID=2611147 RepID=UPI001F37B66B|nr:MULTISPECIES: hypothetical protein [unclassified Sphingobium]
MLMLGALRCKAVNKEIEAKYSAFVDKKIGLLSSYNNVLKTRFMRVNGIAEGQRVYEQFNTKLGNGHSGMAQAGSYCQTIETLLTLATEAQDKELPQLATNFSESAMGIDAVCEAQPVVTAAAPAASAPVVTTAPATGIGGVTQVNAPHEAVTAAGMAVTAEATVGQSRSAAAALEAAAVALQNAAASLKAQAAAPEAVPDKPAAAPEAKPAVLQPITASAAPVG